MPKHPRHRLFFSRWFLVTRTASKNRRAFERSKVLRWLLERYVRGWFQLRGGDNQRTVACPTARCIVDDYAFFDVTLRSWDAPLLRRSLEEHQASHRAHLAEALPLGGRGGAAAGHLKAKDSVVVSSINGRSLDSDFRPVRFQLFVEQHGQAGVDALAHFGVIGDDRDRIVGSDANEGIGGEADVVCRRIVERSGGELRHIGGETQAPANCGGGFQEIAARDSPCFRWERRRGFRSQKW